MNTITQGGVRLEQYRSDAYGEAVRRAGDLRQQLALATPRATIYTGAGLFNLGNTPLLLPQDVADVQVIGEGPEKTIFISSACNSIYEQACVSAVELGLGRSVLEGVTIRHDYDPQWEGEAVGFGKGKAGSAGNCTGVLRNLNIIFRQWGIWSWNGPNNKLDIGDVTMTGWGHFLSNDNTGGPGAWGSIRAHNVEFTGDVSRIIFPARDASSPQGASPGRDGLYIHFVRNAGGLVQLRNCHGSATGNAACDSMRALWVPDVLGTNQPLGSTVIEARDCHFRLTGGGCKDVRDVETPALGQILHYGGSGSGPNGEWVQ